MDGGRLAGMLLLAAWRTVCPRQEHRAAAKMRVPLALPALLGVLLLASCGQRSIVAERPVSAVYELLAAADELPPVFGSHEPDLRMEAGDPKAVAWVLSQKGEEVMRFVATLTAEGEKRTSIDLAVKAPPKFEKRLNDNAAIRDFYVAAMHEQVESTLEGRPYDVSRTYGAMQKAIAANMGNMMRRMDGAAEADQKPREDNIRNADARTAGE